MASTLKKRPKKVETKTKDITPVTYVITDDELAITQDHLDKTKYLDSQAAQKDLSGLMPYCEKCKHRTMQSIDACSGYCDVTHEQRFNEKICARHIRGI